jgi:hypothetical protein
MRTFWIVTVLLILAFCGYAYTKNPAGCMKVLGDFADLVVSLTPVKIEIKNGAATITSNNSTGSTNSAPADTSTNPAPPPPPQAPVTPPPAPSPASAAPGGPSAPLDPNVSGLVPSLLNGNLVAPSGEPYVFPPAAPLSSIKYFAIYYAGAWSPACPAFTAQLLQWYKMFKPAHPDFEIIFVSEDHDEGGQLAFAREMNMPWPAMKFSALKHDGNGTFKGSGIEQFANTGIPDLVLVDKDGKILLDSYQNGNYVGPETVMNGIAGVVTQ